MVRYGRVNIPFSKWMFSCVLRITLYHFHSIPIFFQSFVDESGSDASTATGPGSANATVASTTSPDIPHQGFEQPPSAWLQRNRHLQLLSRARALGDRANFKRCCERTTEYGEHYITYPACSHRTSSSEEKFMIDWEIEKTKFLEKYNTT